MATTETGVAPAATTTLAEPAPGGFVGRFGLDPWLLLAQVVNFLLVLLVLRQFVFRPLVRTMRERAAKVERGLQDAEAAAASRAATERERKTLLARALTDATQTRQHAEEEAHRIREELLRTAEEEAAAMHDRSQREAEAAKKHAVQAAAGEVGNLVVDVSARVLETELTEKDRTRYREAALRILQKRTR